jgi:hypothetical protein
MICNSSGTDFMSILFGVKPFCYRPSAAEFIAAEDPADLLARDYTRYAHTRWQAIVIYPICLLAVAFITFALLPADAWLAGVIGVAGGVVAVMWGLTRQRRNLARNLRNDFGPGCLIRIEFGERFIPWARAASPPSTTAHTNHAWFAATPCC